MMNRPFHPILLSAYPVLALYAANTTLVPMSQVWLPLSAVVVVGAIVWLVASACLRDDARGGLVSSVFMLGLFSYGHVQDVVKASPHSLSWIGFLYFPVWLNLIVLASWKWKSETGATRFANVVGIVLTILPILTIITTITGRKDFRQAALAINPGVKETPDIFYVILDGHGRYDSIGKYIGYSDKAFVDQLRSIGFFVGEKATTNYVQTELSVPSSLNFDYLQHFAPNLDPTRTDRGPMDKAASDGRVAETLKKLGYTYVALRTGFPYFDFHGADLVLGSGSGRSLLVTTIMSMTPLPTSSMTEEDLFEEKREDINGAFANMAELARSTAAPKFVVAHIMAPHPPFVFAADGSPLGHTRAFSIVDGSHYMQSGGTPEEYRNGYTSQVQYVDSLALKTVKTIIERDPKAIIILQGDHGSKVGLDQDSLEKTNLHEVVPILAAIYGPPELLKVLPPDIQPVNEFRYVLNEIFGEKLPILPIHTYYSPWSFPYKFAEVTDLVAVDRR